MIVESITTKDVNTKYGLKPTFSIKAGGDWYSMGFNKPGFKIGDDIEFTSTEGKYGKEIDKGSARVVSSGSASPSAAPTPASAAKYNPGYGNVKPFPIPPLHGDRAIIRQNSLTNAREVITKRITEEVGLLTDAQVAERVIAMARMFEAYSAGDLDLAQAQKEME